MPSSEKGIVEEEEVKSWQEWYLEALLVNDQKAWIHLQAAAYTQILRPLARHSQNFPLAIL